MVFSFQIDRWQRIPLPSQRRCKCGFLTVCYCAGCAVVPQGEAAAESCCALCVWLMGRPWAARVQPPGGVSGGSKPEGMSWGCFSLLCPFPLCIVALGIRDVLVVTVLCLWGFLKEEMNTWIQAITSAISSDKIEVSPTTQSTPASSRAQTLPASVTITSESSPGKREKDKEKDKEKRFSLFGKKK